MPVTANLAEPCATFYELLGFTRIEPPASLSSRAIWLELGTAQIHLEFTESELPSMPGHVAVLTPDYHQVVKSLQTAGHQFEPRSEHWGSPRGFTSDPAGNKVELMKLAPA